MAGKLGPSRLRSCTTVRVVIAAAALCVVAVCRCGVPMRTVAACAAEEAATTVAKATDIISRYSFNQKSQSGTVVRRITLPTRRPCAC
jgi:hypothetical protein